MKKTLLLLISVLLISSCGGGGGGGSTNLATTFLQVEPTTVEVGGNQTIRLELSDVTDNLSIKFRYPEALKYVDTSARFISAESEVITNPAADVSENETASPNPTATPDPDSTATPTAVPTATPTVAPSGTASASTADNYDKNYLVFYISRDAFGADDAGTLILKLRAKEVLDSAKIELDIDLDDPSISNNSEFSVSNPQFEAEESTTIRIRN